MISKAKIKYIQQLGQKKYRRAEEAFVAEGPKIVGDLMAVTPPLMVIATEEWAAMHHTSLPPATELITVTDDELRRISFLQHPQKIMAVFRMDFLGHDSEIRPDELYLALDGVQDPGNVGTILRTLDAFDFDGLLLLEGCADPWSVKTVRSSMGAIFRRDVWCMSASELPGLLERSSLPLYGTALRQDTEDVRGVSLERCAIAIGSEGQGLSDAVLAMCRKTLKIPMSERCESLNAAIAAAVLLWESYR